MVVVLSGFSTGGCLNAMSSPPHQEMAASFRQAAQCLDFGGQ